jgi:hypothetical protein
LSVDKTEHDRAEDVLTMPCPACMEDATVVRDGQEFVPEYALHKYTFEQLDDHLNSDKHSREQLIEVAMRAAVFLYSDAFEKRDRRHNRET